MCSTLTFLIAIGQIPSALGVLYELASLSHAGYTSISVISYEQLAAPVAQEIFRGKHLLVENAPFQTYKFDSFSLQRLFGLGTKLPFVGMWHSHRHLTLFSSTC